MVDKKIVYQAVKNGQIGIDDLKDNYKKDYYSYSLENNLLDEEETKQAMKTYDLDEYGQAREHHFKDAWNTLSNATEVGYKKATEGIAEAMVMGYAGLTYNHKKNKIAELENKIRTTINADEKQKYLKELQGYKDDLDTDFYRGYATMNTDDAKANAEAYQNFITRYRNKTGYNEAQRELEKTANKDGLNKTLNFIGNTVGGVIPTLATAYATGGYGVLPQVALQVEGNKADEMMSEGDATSVNNAMVKSIPYAGIGAGIESLGGIGKIGDKAVKEGTKKFLSAPVKAFLQDALDEGKEEVYENILEAVTDRFLMQNKTEANRIANPDLLNNNLWTLTQNNDSSIVSLPRELQGFLGGAIGGGIFGGINSVGGKYNGTNITNENNENVNANETQTKLGKASLQEQINNLYHETVDENGNAKLELSNNNNENQLLLENNSKEPLLLDNKYDSDYQPNFIMQDENFKQQLEQYITEEYNKYKQVSDDNFKDNDITFENRPNENETKINNLNAEIDNNKQTSLSKVTTDKAKQETLELPKQEVPIKTIEKEAIKNNTNVENDIENQDGKLARLNTQIQAERLIEDADKDYVEQFSNKQKNEAQEVIKDYSNKTLSRVDLQNIERTFGKDTPEYYRAVAKAVEKQVTGTTKTGIERVPNAKQPIVENNSRIVNNVASQKLMQERPNEFEVYKKSAENLGVDVEFRTDMADDDLGQYDKKNNKIYINANAKNIAHQIAMHELVHRIQTLAPTEYNAHKQFVVDVLNSKENSKSFENLMKKYPELGYGNLTPDAITDEIVANFDAKMFSENTEILERMAEENVQHTQTILDLITEIIDGIKKAIFKDNGEKFDVDLSELEQIKTSLEKAIDKAKATNVEMSKPKDNIIRNSIESTIKNDVNANTNTSLKEAKEKAFNEPTAGNYLEIFKANMEGKDISNEDDVEDARYKSYEDIAEMFNVDMESEKVSELDDYYDMLDDIVDKYVEGKDITKQAKLDIDEYVKIASATEKRVQTQDAKLQETKLAKVQPANVQEEAKVTMLANIKKENTNNSFTSKIAQRENLKKEINDATNKVKVNQNTFMGKELQETFNDKKELATTQFRRNSKVVKNGLKYGYLEETSQGTYKITSKGQAKIDNYNKNKNTDISTLREEMYKLDKEINTEMKKFGENKLGKASYYSQEHYDTLKKNVEGILEKNKIEVNETINEEILEVYYPLLKNSKYELQQVSREELFNELANMFEEKGVENGLYVANGIMMQLDKAIVKEEEARLNEDIRHLFVGANNYEMKHDTELARAREMYKDKASNDEIQKETGWYKDNRKWKKEIDDFNSKVDENILRRKAQKKQSVKLQDLFSHDSLYKIYPQFANVDVTFKDLDEAYNNTQKPIAYYGYADINSNTICLNNRLADKPSEARSTLLHEIQHFIQDTEGFEPGANTSVYKTTYYDTPAFKNMVRVYASAKKYNYKNILKETQKTDDDGYYARRNIMEWYMEQDETGNTLPSTLIDDISKKTYVRTFGEIESRLVQARADMTSENRRADILRSSDIKQGYSFKRSQKKERVEDYHFMDDDFMGIDDEYDDVYFSKKVDEEDDVKHMFREKGFLHTADDSDMVTDEVRNKLDKEVENDGKYKVFGNDENLKEAQEFILSQSGENSVQKADNSFRAFKDDRVPKNIQTSVLTEIVKAYEDAGETDKAVDVINTMDELAREYGRNIQYLSLWKQLSGDTKARWLQRTIERYNNTAKKKIDFTADDYTEVKNTMKQLDNIKKNVTINNKHLMERNLKDMLIENGFYNTEKGKKLAQSTLDNVKLSVEELVDRVEKEYMQEYLRKGDVSSMKKVSSFQVISHLLNTSTASRNILGNASFGFLDKVSHQVASVIEKTAYGTDATRMFTSKKDVVFKNGKETLLGDYIKSKAKNEAGKVQLDILLGIDGMEGTKYTSKPTQSLQGMIPTFKNKTLNTLEKALGIELKVPDEKAKALYRENILERYKQAFGEKEFNQMKDELMEYAENEAKYVTFQDDTVLSELMKKIKDTCNIIGTPEFGLGDFLVKYTQVPGNIAMRTIEYSPIGAIKGLVSLGIANDKYQKGEISVIKRNKAIVEFSRGLTGTSLMCLGALLRSIGALTGADDDDENIANLLKDAGVSSGAINLSQIARAFTGGKEVKEGDVLMSFDWLQPASMIINGGAILADKGGIWDVAGNMLDLPCNQSLNTIFNAIKYKDKDESLQEATFYGLLQAGGDSITGFIPSPIRQLANAVDPISRNVYDKGENKVTSIGKQTSKKIANSIPFVSKTLEPNITNEGKKKTYFDGGTLLNLLVQMSPARMTKVDMAEDLDKIKEIMTNSDGSKNSSTSNLPLRYAPNKTQYTKDKEGKKISLTDKQKTEYMKAYARYYKEHSIPYIEDMTETKLNDKQKEKVAKRLSELNTLAKKYAENVIAKAGDR